MSEAQHPIVFSEFAWNGWHWTTTAKLPAWAGYRIRRPEFGEALGGPLTDGTVEILFAPDGQRSEQSPPSEEEIRLVKWVITHEAAIHDSMLDRLFEEYPALREEMRQAVGEYEAEELAPNVNSPQHLKRLLSAPAIKVHQIEKDGEPFVGVVLGCTWDEEHGAGVLLHGDKALEVGGADTASTLWIARKYL